MSLPLIMAAFYACAVIIVLKRCLWQTAVVMLVVAASCVVWVKEEERIDMGAGNTEISPNQYFRRQYSGKT